MNGVVDAEGRAFLALRMRSAEDKSPQQLVAWVDTAFTGELTIPLREVKRLKWGEPRLTKAILADGSTAYLDSYVCFIDWIDGPRAVEVVATEGSFPLLGIGLLRRWRLTVDYKTNDVVLE